MTQKINEQIPYPQPIVSFEDTTIAYSNHSDYSLRKTYLIFALMNQNILVKLGIFLIKIAIKLNLPIKNIIKSTIFNQFCGGEDIQKCKKTIENLAKGHVYTILDYSVEGEDSELDFDKTTAEIKLTIQKAAEESHIAFAVFKISGIGSFDLLEKIQENPQDLTQEDKESFKRIKKRVAELSNEAGRLNVKLFFDAEESWIQEVIDDLAIEMMRKFNIGGKTIIFNTYQMYKHESIKNIKSIIQIANNEGFMIGVKLVRGAYMEKERLRAAMNKYANPIQPDKISTDKDFDKALVLLIENRNLMQICLGTHNQESCQLCIKKMAEIGIKVNDDRFWFAQLLGMSDNISFNLANAGYNVAKYVPYGPVEAVIPYLFRRAEENTSLEGQASREFLFVKSEVKRRKGQK